MEKALLALETIRKGVETGALTLEQAKRLFRESWAKAFGEFDIEKVFWRTTYSLGFLFLGYAFYRTYFWLKNIEFGLRHPESMWADVQKALGWWNPIGSWIAEAIKKGLADEYQSEVLNDPFIQFGGMIFDRWLFPIVTALPFLWAGLEVRDMKRRKALLSLASEV
jgi:hypothetical protein